MGKELFEKGKLSVRHFSRFTSRGKLVLLLVFVASFLMLGSLVPPAFAAGTVSNSQPSQKTWKIVSSPGEGTLQGVAAISANDVWSVGNLNFVTVTEHWNGSAWSIVASPNPAPENNLMSVAAVSTRNVWTVGWEFFPTSSTAAPLIEHWNGSTWSIVASPNPNSNSYLNSVTVVSASDIWAVGYTITQQGNQPLIEQWNGTSWNVISGPSAGQLNGVAAVSTNDVWAVGVNNNKTLIEHWNGTSWTVVSSPGSFSALNGVSVVSASDIWAVGYGPGKTKTATLTEHWNGKNWKIVASANVPGGPLGDQFYAVSVISTNNVWAVGEYSTKSGELTSNPLIEHWNGTAWIVVTNPAPGAYNVLYGVASVPGSKHLWAVGYDAPTGGEPDNTLTEYYG